MSKVLVDLVELEEAAKWLEVHSSSSGSAEAFAAEALREAIAKPAETEGVELVPFWVLFDATTPEPLIKKHMPEGVLAFFDNEEDARRAKALHPGTDYKRAPYVRAATLSAVTAERDRLRKDAERYRWASSGVHEAETLASIVICHGGYAEKVAERVDVYREAAMAAKEE